MVLTSGVENTPTRTAHLFTYLSCYLSLCLSVQSPRSNTFYETLTYFLKKNFEPYTLSRIREVMSRFFLSISVPMASFCSWRPLATSKSPWASGKAALGS